MKWRGPLPAALTTLLLLAGCASAQLAPPQPVFSSLRTIRAAGIPPLAVGRFGPGPGLPAGRDTGLIVRAAPIRPPEGSSFSAYLGETLKTALESAGRLDSTSPITVSGLLDENRIDAGLGHGGGSLAATFVVSHAGQEVWRKSIRVEREWDSSVIGSVAFMQAEVGYGGLYQQLVESLIADPEFQRVVKPDP